MQRRPSSYMISQSPLQSPTVMDLFTAPAMMGDAP